MSNVRLSLENSAVGAYEYEFVKNGKKISQIAKEFNISIYTLSGYRSKYGWIDKRRRYLRAKVSLVDVKKVAEKDRERSNDWEEVRRKIMVRIRQIDVDEEGFEVKINSLVNALKRAIEGERLEDEQPTIIEKKVKQEEVDKEGFVDPMENIKVANFIQNNNYGTSSSTDESIRIEGEVPISIRGTEGGKDDNRSSEINEVN